MKRAPRTLYILLAVLCFAGLLKATLPQIGIGQWTSTSNLTQARSNSASVLLADGRILIIGGENSNGPLASAEIFGTDGIVSSAGLMNAARSRHFAVVLSDGRVLVGGGTTSGGGTTNSAEIYDPAANSWTQINPLTTARANATAALLQDGRVLIAGGASAGVPSSTIEIYDPSTGNFSFAATLSTSRTQHAMAVLQDGRVLIAGGFDGTNPLSSSDIYDPSSGNISAGPNLATARYAASATTLLNGDVAVIGGAGSAANGGTTDLGSIEIFDSSSAAFKPAGTSLANAREGHQAFLLPNNNNVLIVGGSFGGTVLASSESLAPQISTSDGSWSYIDSARGNLNTPRAGTSGSANQKNGPTSAVPQKPGLVIVAGGTDASGAPLASTEAYGYATVQSDQGDYPPGTNVKITGSGFQPNENVDITLVESPLIDTHGPYTVQADANGNITDSSFTTDSHDMNVRIFLSAAGEQSKLVAQNAFTDGPKDTWDSSPSNFTLTLNPGQSIPSGTSVTYTVTSGTNTHVTFPVTATTTLNGAPAWASLNKSSISITGYGSIAGDSVILSGSVPCTQAAGLLTFQIRASLTNNVSVLQANQQNTPVNITISSTPDPSCIVNTTTTVASSLSPSIYGTSVTFTATVSPNTGTSTPTGSVQFAIDNGTPIAGTVSTCPVGATPNSLCATYTTPSLSVDGGTAHSVQASYTHSGSFADSNGSLAGGQRVNKANATVVVTPYTNVPYDGHAHTATVTSITGVNGETAATVGTVDVSNTTHTNAGTYSSDSWSFTGTANYNNIAATTITDSIAKANATVVVAPYTNVPYDGHVHTATVTSITGVNGETGATVGTVDVSNTTHTKAGTYSSDSWSFTGTANYNNIAATTFTDTINKANATILVMPYDVVYDAAAHAATGSATGVLSESLLGLDLAGTNHTNAGSYVDTWNFIDVTGNYNNATGTVSDVIEKARPTITWATPAAITYGTALSNTQLNATTNVPGNFAYNPSSGAVLGAGAHQVLVTLFTPTDSTDYTTANATVYVDVNKATPIIVWGSPADITYGTALGDTQLNAIALPPTSALTAWFKADGNIDDSSPTANSGTSQNVGYVTGFDGSGQAFSFDASQMSGVTAPYQSGYDLNPPGFTAAFWIKGSPSGQQTILDKSYDGSTGWDFEVNPTGNLQFNIGEGNNQFAQVMSNVNVLDGNFHFVTGTWNGGTKMALYVDGALQNTTTLTAAVVNNQGRLNIGFSRNSGSNYLTGAVDEVQIFDLSLPTGTYTYAPPAGTVLSAGPAQALSMSFTPDDATDLISASASVNINVLKANAKLSVAPYSVTYDGNPHTATGTATGINNESLSGLDLSGTAHTNAGTFTDTWTFTDSTGNYNNANGTVMDMINKTDAVISVIGYTVTYDGNPHTATGTASGAKGEPLSGLDLSATTHTNAGNSTDGWTFTDTTGNYNNASGTVKDCITKANATVVVLPYTLTYDGSPHTATYTITGVNGETGAMVGTVDVSNTTHTNAGTYSSDSWSFTGTANYNNIAATTITDSIAKASATVVVTPYTNVSYDGNAHTATVTSITGVNGETAATVGTVDVSNTTHTNAGTYSSDSWSFTGTANYNNIAATTITDTIMKANATINVTPYNVTYDGNSHIATGTARGVKGESLSGLDLSKTTHSSPGSYTDPWTFTDLTGNYNNVPAANINDIIHFATGMTCNNGAVSHVILQPINADGTSVFKAGSTVPTKFVVCDAFGNSVGPTTAFTNVVKSYAIAGTLAGTVVENVDETVTSTTPDSAFRWDATSQQWIFNTKTGSGTNLNRTNTTYLFQITLIDGTVISGSNSFGAPGYQLGLK
jgi:hypothetical protein